MKKAILKIVGKTIAGVVVKESDHRPQSMIFLIFTDGTYYELYSTSGDMSGAGGIDPGGLEAVQRYFNQTHHIVLQSDPPA